MLNKKQKIVDYQLYVKSDMRLNYVDLCLYIMFI